MIIKSRFLLPKALAVQQKKEKTGKRELCLVIIILVMLFQANDLFSDEITWDLAESRSFGKMIVPGLIASGETLLGNAIPILFNGLVMRFGWSYPTATSIRKNFSEPWDWDDTDDFLVNQIGHSYHGHWYFGAGRINGFGFYSSLFFSALGSFTWEAFCESNHASISDLITTVSGSMATGEILYRLYDEAFAAGIPVPFLLVLNPIVAFHNLLSGAKPVHSAGNLYQFGASLGAGYVKTQYDASDGHPDLFHDSGFYADIAFGLIYGNPFEQDTWVPYRHFELDGYVGMNPGRYVGLRIISDGYLFSFSPLYSGSDTMSTGLSLHLDYNQLGEFSFTDSTINHFNNALDWTMKYRHLFSQHTNVQIKMHAGFTFNGASKYYLPGRQNEELNNFGYGINAKTYFRLELMERNMLELSGFFYILWTFPGTSEFSHGNVIWWFGDLTYSFAVAKHVSLGAAASYASEQGTFSGFPDTKKRNIAAKMFVAWNL